MFEDGYLFYYFSFGVVYLLPVLLLFNFFMKKCFIFIAFFKI